MGNKVGNQSKEISLSDCCDILEQSTVEQSIDIGSAIIHKVKHPKHGSVLLVNTACGRAAQISI